MSAAARWMFSARMRFGSCGTGAHRFLPFLRSAERWRRIMPGIQICMRRTGRAPCFTTCSLHRFSPGAPDADRHGTGIIFIFRNIISTIILPDLRKRWKEWICGGEFCSVSYGDASSADLRTPGEEAYSSLVSRQAERLEKGTGRTDRSGCASWRAVPVEGHGECSCYLPWENCERSLSQKDGWCELPDFRRSIVVRIGSK